MGKRKTAQHRDNIAISVANHRARAHRSPLVAAIQASEWKTITAYAARLEVSQSALSRYLAGSLNCPERVDDIVRVDFPKLAKMPAAQLWGAGLLVHGAGPRAVAV